MNNQILSKHRSKSFNILFERRLNNLENKKETPATTTNTLVIEARAKDIGEIIFLTIRTKAKKDVKKKYKDKNKKKKI
jgi:hypothetical protein